MSKKRVLIFDYDKMRRAGQLINMIQVSGVPNVRALSELSYILDSGRLADEDEAKGDEKEVDGT